MHYSPFARLEAMIVEDQAFIRTVVSRILKQLEFRNVWEAADGATALTMMADRRPDVIICDIEMEPMDGLTLLTKLRENPEQARIPVIFLTNHAHRDVVLKARDLGVNGFIAKPVTVVGLRDKLCAVLGIRR